MSLFDGLSFVLVGRLPQAQAKVKAMLIEHGGVLASAPDWSDATHVIVADAAVGSTTVPANCKAVPLSFVLDAIATGVKPVTNKSPRGKRAAQSPQAADPAPQAADPAPQPPTKRSRKTKAEPKDDSPVPVAAPAAAPAPVPVPAAAAAPVKVEPDVKSVTVVRKGRAAVDADCPIAAQVHVYEDSTGVYDALLNQVDIANNHNKYYTIQMLQSDSNASAYYVWTHWGRVGKTAGTDLRNCSSRDDAIRAFGEKFSSKTKNHWADRQHFVSYSGKYTLLARDYFAEEEKKNPAPAANATVSSAVPKSKLDARLQDLIQLICDTKMMSRELAELNYDANKLPLGKLTKEIVLKGYAALEEINRALKNNAKAPELQRLSSQFYTYIPHDFGMRRPTVIMTRDLLAEKIRMVEQLAEVEIATKLLNQGQNSSSADAVHPLDAHFANLHCGIRPVDLKSQEAELVRQYINNTHGHTHSEYKLLLEDLFVLDRESESEKFASSSHAHSNRQLLWHGSRLTNYVGILSQGLRIAPPEAPATGYMFGKGVYFADCVSKSANYCFASQHDYSSVGCMLLCEVALGNPRELLQSDYNADRLPANAHSTKGVGRTQPDPSGAVVLPDGVKVPCGKVQDVQVPGSALQYNEYIVYNTNQVKLKYLLKVRFDYSRK